MLGSSLSEIPAARAWARELVLAGGFGEEDVFALEVALAEALSNVVRHAYGGRPGGVIALEVDVEADLYRVRIHDQGVPFQRESWEPPDCEQPREGGYGVQLIEEVMDEVTRERNGETTTLTLVRHRRGGGGEPR